MVLLLMVLFSLAAASNAIASPTTTGSSTDRFGTYPSWASAILTGFAFLVTASIFARDRRDRVREQANAVYAWQDKNTREGTVVISVTNASDMPIWDVTVQPCQGTRALNTKPSQTGPGRLKPKQPGVWEWTIPAVDVEKLERSPELRFTDAADRSWIKVGSSLRREHRSLGGSLRDSISGLLPAPYGPR